MLPNLSDIKRNLRLDDDSEDDYISSLISPAFEVFKKDCNRLVVLSANELDENDKSTTMLFDDMCKRALILLVSHWFNHRESSTDLKLVDTPMAYAHIVGLLRVTPC